MPQISRGVLLIAPLLIVIPVPAQTQTKPGAWTTTVKHNVFDGDQTRTTLSVAADFEGRRGTANITASCGDTGGSDSAFLALEVAYHSATDKDLGFEASELGTDVLPDFKTAMDSGFGDYVPRPFPDFRGNYLNAIEAVEHTPVVKFRAKIDNQKASGYSKSKYSNVLTLNFFDHWNSEQSFSPPFGVNRLPPVASLKAGFTAAHILVELPLTNGDRPLIDINLRDQTFRKFASHCEGSDSQPLAATSAPPSGNSTLAVHAPPTNSGKKSNLPAGVAAGMLLQSAPPEYPAEARAQHAQGVVVLQVTVSPDGSVVDARAVSGPELLVPPALEAVRKYRYRPYLVNNLPMAFQTFVNVAFKPGS